MAPLCAQLWLPETKGVGDSGIKAAVSVPAASRNPSKKKNQTVWMLNAQQSSCCLMNGCFFFSLTRMKRANTRRYTGRPSLFIFKVEHFNSPSPGAVCGWPGAALCGPRLGTKRKNMGGRRPTDLRVYLDFILTTGERAAHQRSLPRIRHGFRLPSCLQRPPPRSETRGATPVVVSAAATPLVVYAPLAETQLATGSTDTAQIQTAFPDSIVGLISQHNKQP